MKKSYKFLSIALALSMTVGGLSACKPESNIVIDETKTQIYVYAVNNGVGCQWIYEMAERFNALPENAEYQVVPQSGELDLLATLKAQLQAKTTDTNIYFGSQSAITSMIESDLLLDVSDVYDMKVDGENGGTIGEKTYNFDIVKDSFCNLAGEGIYGIPYAIGMAGMVFDFEFFLENGYMLYAKTSELGAVNASGTVAKVNGDKLECTLAFGNYEVGDKILSAGFDGKYGTYDDGQAQTYAEFNNLMLNILDTPDTYPFIYTTQYVEANTPPIYQGAFVQEMGLENYKTFMSLRGDIKDKAGNVQATITAETGNTAWDTQVVKNAYETSVGFYHDYLMGLAGELDGVSVSADKIVHPSSYQTTSLSHRDAQDKFVSSYRNPSNIGNAAFLIEGVWWEGTEARGTLEKLGQSDASKGYGKREFRYYLFPKTETQVSEKSIIACQDDGIGVLLNNIPKKCDTEEKKTAFVQKCKEFLAYTLSDESLEYYTLKHGIARPYDYELSEATYNALTPFQKNCWDITHDTENIDILYVNFMKNMSVLRSNGGLKDFQTSKIQKGETNAEYETPYSAFKSTSSRLTKTEYINGIYKYVQENYKNIYDLNKEYIYE